MKIPIISDLLGGKPEPQAGQLPQEKIDVNRLATTIPTMQGGQPPTYEVVREVAKTKQLDDNWKKRFRGFDVDNALPYGNIAPGEDDIIRMEYEIQQEILYNFTPIDSVFDDDFKEERLYVIQDSRVVKQQASKGINSNLSNRALGTYTSNKTEIQAGNTQQQQPPQKGGLLSFLFR